MNAFGEELRTNDRHPRRQMRAVKAEESLRRKKDEIVGVSGAINLESIDNAVYTAKRTLHPLLSFVFGGSRTRCRRLSRRATRCYTARRENEDLPRLRFESYYLPFVRRNTVAQSGRGVEDMLSRVKRNLIPFHLS